jgi:hypothetical protein
MSGGVAFAPTGGGTGTVKAEIPNFVTTAAGSTTVVVVGGPTAVPPPAAVALSLEPNAPNPFNPTTTIRFTLPAQSHVNLSVFDVRGRHIATLVDGVMPAGPSSAVWNGRNRSGAPVSSGVYFCRLTAGPNVRTRKMVLLK